MTKKIREYIIATFIFAVSSFFFLTESPFHPWINGTPTTDSSVFKTVAMVMEHGGMPYKDTFDHKGPLVYIINWLGNRISDYRGVWVIEFVFLLITLIALYKTARLFCDKAFSYVSVFFSFSLLFTYFDGGNYTEEYALPFIAIAQYIFIDYLVNNVISKSRLIICGLSLAAVLMLRPNMIAIWIVMCLLILGELIITKSWKNLGEFTLWFVLGMAILILPIMIWLAVGGAIKDFWQDFIVFNFSYSAAVASTAGRVNAFFGLIASTSCLIALFITCFLVKSDKRLNISYLIYMLLSFILTSMSGTIGDSHYGMVLMPIVCYPLSVMFGKIKDSFPSEKSKIISILLSTYVCVSCIFSDWAVLMQSMGTIYEERNESHRESRAETVASIINSELDEDDTISVYGNWDAVYIISNRLPASKYSYQYPLFLVDPTILDDYFSELEENKPKMIVISEAGYSENIASFMGKNDYTLYWTNSGEDMRGIFIYMLE